MSVFRNIADAAFFQWPETQALVSVLEAISADFRFVGGSVRDVLLGTEVKDVDLCTPVPAALLMQQLQAKGISCIPTGIEHGTITVCIAARRFEITTLRRDMACDGRHAVVAYTDNYEEDAARRDFTVNALSCDRHGQLFDYHDGVADMEARLLRFIGIPADRIREDALRILRLFRFQAVLGFLPDRAALDAAASLKSGLSKISAERIKAECFKLMVAPFAEAALLSMHRSGIWEELFGRHLAHDISAVVASEQALARPASATLRFAWLALQAMNADAVDDRMFPVWLQERLHLSNHETHQLELLLGNQHAIQPSLSLAEQRALQRRFGTDDYLASIVLACARDGAPHVATYQEMSRQALEWRIPEFPIGGRDLLEIGYTEGAAVGKALQVLEEAWEMSGYTLSREALLERAAITRK